MILDELVVHNFGLFAERQKIELTPPEPEKSIILFGGLNGHGKTTLLDAMQLCLYGPFANTSNRNGKSYHDYLTKCVHSGSRVKEAAVEIAFRHTVDGHEHRYRLHRSWSVGSSGCRERFEVLKNRRREDALAENWIAEVEDLIPPNIAGLFLFDGEQVERYATQESSMQLIGSAIRNLLGLDIVDQLSKDLIVYSRRKRMEEKNDPARPDIEKAEGLLRKLDAHVASLEEERKDLESNRIAPLRKKLGETEDEYRRLGGELFEERVRIEQELSATERNLEAGAERLRTFATGDLPLLLVRDLLDVMQAQDKVEEVGRLSRELATELEDHDRDLMEEMHRLEIEDAKMSAVAIWLRERRSLQRKEGERAVVLGLPPATRADLNFLLNGGIDDLHQAVVAELKNRPIAKAQAENARNKFESIPRGDLIGEVARQRDVIHTELAALEGRLERIDEELDRVVRERERNGQALVRLIEADARVEGLSRDRARTLVHVGRVRTTLEAFRSTVIERHVKRISNLVLESYQQLLRKSSLVTRLEIDPESFLLTLFGRDGSPLGADRLSAGERQLLAIALLWGLAKASGRALPTAIDTPLGRLDAGHRRFLVERYFPYASHQVLLLSTDEEISGEYLDELSAHVGRSYCLAYDDVTNSTKIKEGYFDWGKVN